MVNFGAFVHTRPKPLMSLELSPGIFLKKTNRLATWHVPLVASWILCQKRLLSRGFLQAMFIVKGCARPDLSKNPCLITIFLNQKNTFWWLFRDFSLKFCCSNFSPPVFVSQPKQRDRSRPPPTIHPSPEAGGEPKVSPKKCPGLELEIWVEGLLYLTGGCFWMFPRIVVSQKYFTMGFKTSKRWVGNGVSEASTVALLIFGCFQKFWYTPED